VELKRMAPEERQQAEVQVPAPFKRLHPGASMYW
jgi:hypothetical protein